MYHNTRLLSFLSTLSLRRATAGSYKILPRPVFLSTLSLRRATRGKAPRKARYLFLSTLSPSSALKRTISIHALLAESDITPAGKVRPWAISIHALLAESDGSVPSASGGAASISIHALLAESDFGLQNRKKRHNNFYPRSPCGERLGAGCTKQTARSFLSTLSLRRATAPFPSMVVIFGDFYPRSPCGERPPCPRCSRGTLPISIHALLAESDAKLSYLPVLFCEFLSTLSLRRATQHRLNSLNRSHNFYPRSPCGERRAWMGGLNFDGRFLSTLSLRRATFWFSVALKAPEFLSTLSLRRATTYGTRTALRYINFYPRSPCGERPEHLLII